jgi:hypothetical protein
LKRLWVKYLSLLLILAQTSVLFADTLTFNNGQKINGKLIDISEEHELDPNTGVTSEVTFKVDEYQLKMISEELIVGKVDKSTLMFDKKSIYKITDDKGNLLFTHNKKLKDKISAPLPFEPKCRDKTWYGKDMSPEECNAGVTILLYGSCSLLVFAFLAMSQVII